MFLKKLLIAIVVALCLAQYCEAIKCIKCGSHKDPTHCGEKYVPGGPSSEEIDCDKATRSQAFQSAAKPTACSTLVFKDAVGHVTIRDCHYVAKPTDKCSIDTAEVGSSQIITCQSCTSDLCNSAASKYISMGSILLTLFAVVLLR